MQADLSLPQCTQTTGKHLSGPEMNCWVRRVDLSLSFLKGGEEGWGLERERERERVLGQESEPHSVFSEGGGGMEKGRGGGGGEMKCWVRRVNLILSFLKGEGGWRKGGGGGER